MPYGLTNAPATFQRLMDRLLGPELEPTVFAYLDDVIIVTETFEDHLRWLDKVVSIIKEAGLVINWDKSHFCCSEVRFLGYLVNKEGLAPDQERIQPVLDFPPPINATQIKRFLGMVGWYGRFLPDLARDKIPLVKLLRGGEKWVWGQEQVAAFEKLKQALCSAPVLARPNFRLPFTVQTDASAYAIGAVLTQVQDGEEHPIVYISRVLTRAEQKYTVTEKECLAVIWAVKKLRPYIEGYAFTVVTDHSSLRWLNRLKDPTGRLARWALALQAYNYRVEYRKGKLNDVPDALSRIGDPVEAIAVISENTDPWYQKRIRQVQQDSERYPDWKVEDGILYCHRPCTLQETLGPDLDAWKVVVPLESRQSYIDKAHSDPSAGHLGTEKTFHRLWINVYWPGMHREVAKFVKTCVVCQQVKVSQQPPLGFMGSRVVEKPWTVVSGDVMGPFPPSRQQFRYIVVYMDNFSKWVEIRPLRKADGKSTAKALEETVLYRWGAPMTLLTDNGTEFCNKDMTKTLASHGIRQVTIPPYHAQANPVERVNRVVKTMITAFVEQDHRDWDLHLYQFMYAINTALHSSAGSTPAFINLGRNPAATNSSPVTSQAGKLVQTTPQEWIDRVARLTHLHDLVRQHLAQASARQAKYYNKGRADVKFRVGDLVWRRNHVLSSATDRFAAKLAPKYAGYYRIKKVLSPVVYELEDDESRINPKVHVSDLKHFIGSLGHNIVSKGPVSTDGEPGTPPVVKVAKNTTPKGRVAGKRRILDLAPVPASRPDEWRTRLRSRNNCL